MNIIILRVDGPVVGVGVAEEDETSKGGITVVDETEILGLVLYKILFDQTFDPI